MKISKSSWHYRLMNKMSHRRVPTSLCPYMRRLALFLLMLAVASGVIGLGIAGVFSFILHWLPWFVVNEFLFETGAILLIAACILLLIGVVFFVLDYLDEKRRANKQIEEVREPGLVRSYITAIHDKVCPYLTFE